MLLSKDKLISMGYTHDHGTFHKNGPIIITKGVDMYCVWATDGETKIFLNNVITVGDLLDFESSMFDPRENDPDPEFRPCPFCGSDHLIHSMEKSPDGSIEWHTLMHGPVSECSIQLMEQSKEQLHLKWNSRMKDVGVSYDHVKGHEFKIP